MPLIIKSADSTIEKHVPIIKQDRNGDEIKLTVSIGDKILHPNTVEHHIKWVEVYFIQEGTEIPHAIGKTEFAGHNDLILTKPKTSFSFKTRKKGSILAIAYCNIHGLWQSEMKLL